MGPDRACVMVQLEGADSGAPVVLTRHALDRWDAERVRPGLRLEDADADLRRLLGTAGRLALRPPAWLGNRLGVCLYLVVGDFVLPTEIGPDGGEAPLRCSPAVASQRRRAQGGTAVGAEDEPGAQVIWTEQR